MAWFVAMVLSVCTYAVAVILVEVVTVVLMVVLSLFPCVAAVVAHV